MFVLFLEQSVDCHNQKWKKTPDHEFCELIYSQHCVLCSVIHVLCFFASDITDMHSKQTKRKQLSPSNFLYHVCITSRYELFSYAELLLAGTFCQLGKWKFSSSPWEEVNHSNNMTVMLCASQSKCTQSFRKYTAAS